MCRGKLGHETFKRSPTTPIVPCSDMCGTIVESKSKLWKSGQRVVALPLLTYLDGSIQRKDLDSALGLPLDGVLAGYRCFPAESLVKAPDYLTDPEASCLPTASVTAWVGIQGTRALGEAIDKSRKATVLVQGTDGIALAAVQIARALGLKTIVTASSEKNLERAGKDLKADNTINNRKYWEWAETVLDMTSHAGADIIFGTGGMRTLRKSLDCVAVGGIINCVGYTSGKGEEEDKAGDANSLNVNALAHRSQVTLQGLLSGPKDRMEEMLAFYEKEGIKPVVAREFAFDDAGEAMKYLEQGDEAFGKVVIKIS